MAGSAYVARQDIKIGEALAYTRGQRVEADAVKANGWQDLVVGEDTKEARQIAAEFTGQPVEDTRTAPAKAAAPKTQEG